MTGVEETIIESELAQAICVVAQTFSLPISFFALVLVLFSFLLFLLA
jgi:hypothetical protein